ncbi:hypothetical protein T233_00621 [Vagococcus lutrae LBD1]|uniref:Glycosyltransferase 2-like domain-containing protein n=1 Tax=Vagococcus lutrae LBD1 TaxID=1408226 RepID=V6QCK9_9ENTE|nr:glycosyltransferase [Vagococcus lutrae]EST90318.1 hypothetical protein T233_00621 [Vagococcus lutrae LBD1]
MKLISIIIPMFNAQNSIATTLESIISQKYKKAEIIIIDDGSIDKSKEIVQTYLDEDIKYIYQDNKGVSAARNLGIENSQGKYVMFVDADDTLKKDSLKIIDKILTNENPDLLVFNSGKRKKNKNDSKCDDIVLSFITDDDISGYVWNKLFKLDKIKCDNLLFDENIHFCEDLLFCVTYCTMNPDLSVKYIADKLYNYEPDETSITALLYSLKKHTGLIAIQKVIDNIQNTYDNKCIKCYYDYYYRFLISLAYNGYVNKSISRKELMTIIEKYDCYEYKGFRKTKYRYFLLKKYPKAYCHIHHFLRGG